MFKMKLFYLAILFILIVCFFIWQMTAFKAPEPKYQVIQAEGDIEIRQYPSLIVAEVLVEGERYAAINNGFRILADYIFGNNTTEKKIAMTAPVIQQGVKIPMTATITQQKVGEFWSVRFVMPAEFTLKTLPKPNTNQITLIELPAKKYAVIRFSGWNSENNLSKHETKLMDYISKQHLKQRGKPIFAFYNPPWILPFLRRNEVMVEID